MGEIAELIIEGDCCQFCMMPMSGMGFVQTCDSCAESDDKHIAKLKRKMPHKVKCPYCEKSLKNAGLIMHIKAKHPEIQLIDIGGGALEADMKKIGELIRKYKG